MSSSPGLSNAKIKANKVTTYKRVGGFGSTVLPGAVPGHAGCATRPGALQLTIRAMSDTGAAVPQGRPSSQVDEITATMTAVCTLLVRQCLGAAKLDDADAARRLSRHLVGIGAPNEIMAIATVGVWAGYRPDDGLDEDVLDEVVELTRAVAGSYEHEGMTMLAATTLVLLVRRGCSD